VVIGYQRFGAPYFEVVGTSPWRWRNEFSVHRRENFKSSSENNFRTRGNKLNSLFYMIRLLSLERKFH
jgi:hypothetical protein